MVMKVMVVVVVVMMMVCAGYDGDDDSCSDEYGDNDVGDKDGDGDSL